MKKLFVLFTVLVSFFVFNIMFKEVSSNEYSKQKYLFTNVQESKPIERFYTKFDVDNEDKEIFLTQLITFLEENNYSASIMSNEKITYFNDRISQYFYTNDKTLVKRLYTIKENNYIDFSKDSNQYYTSDLSDKKSDTHIIFLDNTYNKPYNDIITIQPLSKIIHNTTFKERELVYVSIYAQEKNELITNIQVSPLRLYLIGDNYLASETDYVEITKSGITFKVLIVIALSLLLISICYIVQMRKEILVRKMLGMTNFYITKKLFLNSLLVILLIYLMTQLACFTIFIGNFYANSHRFFIRIFINYTFVVLLVCIVFIVLFFIVKYLDNINALKREKVSAEALKINWILKVVAIVLLMSPSIIEIYASVDNIKLHNILQKEEKNLKKEIYINGIDTGSNGELFASAKEKLLVYFNEHGYYQNFTSEEMNKMMEASEQSDLPYLEANVNYLSLYELYDINNKKIDFRKLNDKTFLIPEKYMNENISQFMGSNHIFIKGGNKFARKDIPSSYQSYTLSDPIIKVYKNYDAQDNYGFGPLFNILPIETQKELDRFETFLISEGLYDICSFNTYEDDYKVFKYQLENKLLVSFILVSIQLTTIFLFLFETIYLMINQNRKLYALKYIFGNSFIERYIDFFISNFIIYVIIFLAGIILYQIEIMQVLTFIWMMFIFESIVFYIVIKNFEKKHTVSTLKGD